MILAIIISWLFVQPCNIELFVSIHGYVEHDGRGATPPQPAGADMSENFCPNGKFLLLSSLVFLCVLDAVRMVHSVDVANAAAFLFFKKWGGVAELHFLQTKNAVPCSACALSALMANAVRIEKEIFSLSADSVQHLFPFQLSQLFQASTAGSGQFAVATQSHQAKIIQ